jgi:hypothetical protein
MSRLAKLGKVGKILTLFQLLFFLLAKSVDEAIVIDVKMHKNE